jgi:CHAD domain-containing protein
MKAAAILKKYYHKRVYSIRLLLEKPQENFTEKDFHTLRVEIKRIKAVYALVNACVKNFNRKKNLKPLTTFFRQAGKVRELQLLQAVVKKFKPDPSLNRYFRELTQQSAIEQDKFFTLMGGKLKKDVNGMEKKTAAFFDKVDNKSVLEFLREKRKDILTFFKTEIQDTDHYHELRKQIKELYYLEKIFSPKNKRLVIADDYQELLGEWHDSAVISEKLDQKMHNRKLSPSEIKGLKSLQKKISTRADRLLLKIKSHENPLL